MNETPIINRSQTRYMGIWNVHMAVEVSRAAAPGADDDGDR